MELIKHQKNPENTHHNTDAHLLATHHLGTSSQIFSAFSFSDRLFTYHRIHIERIVTKQNIR
jgi:hypothetical protein